MIFKEFFYFTKSDRQVIVFLLVFFVAGILLVRWLNRQPILPETPQETAADKEQERKERRRDAYADINYTDYEKPAIRLSAFDPNTADAQQLLALGLQPWQVRSLLKYRAKGGVFRRASDFAKLYGLTRKQYEELEPYIQISDDYRPAAELFAGKDEKTGYERDTLRFPAKIKEGVQVQLNAADTAMLKKVPGIGSYFARQIVNYRQRLGGFVAVEQLLEIEDFPSESLRFFQITVSEKDKINKLNLNKLTLNQLKRHPYMGFYRARAIVDYRRLHGALRSLDDLRLIPDFSQEWVEKMEGYVEF